MHERMSKKPAPQLDLDQWSDLSLFLAVTRSGSFTAAARKLGIEQSTVSRRIRALEEALGVVLFERHATRSRLTPLGEGLLRRAESIEAEVHAFTDEARGAERDVSGRVRLALTESIAAYAVIPRVLPVLRKKHPELTIELLTSYQTAELGHREAEMALRFYRPESGDLVATRVARMQTAFLAHKRHRNKKKSELDFIVVRLDGIPTVEESFLERHVGKSPVLVTSSYLAQVEAVRAGIGAALIPRSLLDFDRSLVELDLGVPRGPELELWLVAPSSLRRVPRIDAVWSALEQELRFLGR